MPQYMIYIGLSFTRESVNGVFVERTTYGEVPFQLQPPLCQRYDSEVRDAEVHLRYRAGIAGLGHVARAESGIHQIISSSLATDTQ